MLSGSASTEYCIRRAWYVWIAEIAFIKVLLLPCRRQCRQRQCRRLRRNASCASADLATRFGTVLPAPSVVEPLHALSKVVKQKDPDTQQKSILFQIQYPKIEEGRNSNHSLQF